MTPEQSRRERTAQLVAALKFDALLVTSLHNVRYLTGFTGSSANVLIFRDGRAVLFTDPRYAVQSKQQVNCAIRIAKGATVADIGAGVGFFTWRLAARIGPQGKVYAVDIQQGMLDQLRRNMAERHLANYEAVLGAEDDPRLPAGRIDLALLVDVYHEFSQPQKMLQGIRRALKPDGRLVQLEYRKEDPNVPILADHKMSVAEAKTEVEAEGFKLGPVIETLPRQHILIYMKAAAK